MAGLEDFFKGYNRSQVEQAMKRAKMLSENPQVQQAFARVDQEDIINMLRNLSSTDKNELMKTFLKSENRELVELLKKLK
ncbi:MAG: hypothetical protein J6K51_00820 [Clostridia bacterium]|nr:hypothetical protein [Clostridia bacterium]